MNKLQMLKRADSEGWADPRPGTDQKAFLALPIGFAIIAVVAWVANFFFPGHTTWNDNMLVIAVVMVTLMLVRIFWPRKEC